MNRRRFIIENGLHLSFAVALIATLGSLYLSEIMQFEPCKLCWLQRICMYPLVVLLGVAAARKDYKISIYVLPLAVIGALIAVYHYLVQKTEFFKSHTSSCGMVPCDSDYLDWFGVITIPLMALVAFIVIIVLHVMLQRALKKENRLHFSL